MVRLILILCVFYAISCNCQQPQRVLTQNDLREREARNRFNLELPQDIEPMPRRKRLNNHWVPTFCAATGVRLDITLPKIFGIWFPLQTSTMAYETWTTSLYGGNGGDDDDVMCTLWNIQPAIEMNTVKIEVSHRTKAISVEAFLLDSSFNSKTNKWVVSWPNGADTLTSVVAVGNYGKNRRTYDWMVTVDCDLSGAISSDWTVFARRPTMTSENLTAIISIMDSIKGLDTLEAVDTGEACRTNTFNLPR